MRKLLLCSFFMPASLIIACGGGGGAKSAQELGDKVLAALQAKDFSQVKSLYWTADAALSLCTEIPEDKKSGIGEKFAKELASAEKDFDKCLKTDWSDAKVVGIKGGETDDPLKGCAGKAMEVEDIKVQIEAGGKKHEVKLNDPVKVGDAYFLVEDIRCRAPEVSCADIYDKVAAMDDIPEDQKEMFSGDMKDKFIPMCERMKDDPEGKMMLACVAEANNYADVDACEKKMRDSGDSDSDADMDEPTAAVAEPAVADEPAAAEGDSDDLCAKYIANVQECTKALPESARGQIEKSLETMKSTLEGQPDEAKNSACRMALDTAKKAMTALCPDVKWD